VVVWTHVNIKASHAIHIHSISKALELCRDGVSACALDDLVRWPALLEHVADVLCEDLWHLRRGKVAAARVLPLEDEVNRVADPPVEVSAWGCTQRLEAGTHDTGVGATSRGNRLIPAGTLRAAGRLAATTSPASTAS
jgi:hypothetical protein